MRASASQVGDAPLDVAGQPGQRLAPEEGQEPIQVGIDGQNLDALGTQETSQRRKGRIGRRGITGRRIDECKLHARRTRAVGRPSAVEFSAGINAGTRLSAEGNTEYTWQRRELIMRRAAFILAVLAGACGSDSAANVAGTYTIALTIQQNECGILGNDPGTSSSGVTVEVTQDGSNVTAKVQGLAGLALGVATGSATFTGKVSGNSLDLSISGTVSGSSGTCAFTRNAHLVGTVSGDVLTGSVTYTYATNKTADCGTRDSCQDIQVFNGTRPPTVSL